MPDDQPSSKYNVLKVNLYVVFKLKIAKTVQNSQKWDEIGQNVTATNRQTTRIVVIRVVNCFYHEISESTQILTDKQTDIRTLALYIY